LGQKNEEAFRDRDRQQQTYPVQASYHDLPSPSSTHFPREDPIHGREGRLLCEEVWMNEEA
jgi:hypothetical protein